MNKQDFVKHICANFECKELVANAIVKVFTESVLLAISEGNNIHIDGLGSFKILSQPERQIYNSKIGRTIKIPPYNKPHFTPAKELRGAVR